MGQRGGDGGWAERWLRPIRAKLDEGYTPAPSALADGIFVVERRLLFPFGLTMRSNTTVLVLPGGGLVLHSPVRVDPPLRRALDDLGRVEAILAPNPFHYLFLHDAHEAFPEATLFVAPGLTLRVPGLPPARRLGEASPAWEGSVEEAAVGPRPEFSEVALLHRPSRTLVLTDLAFHLAFERGWNRVAWRLSGIPAGFGPSRTARMLLLRDRGAARPGLATIASWSFDRITVAHGEPVTRDARAEFARAFAPYLQEADIGSADDAEGRAERDRS